MGTKFLNISVDDNLGSEFPSDVTVSSQKAVKSYVDGSFHEGSNAFTGTDGSGAGLAGLVPAPAASDAGKVLGSGGSWVPAPVPVLHIDVEFLQAETALPSGTVITLPNGLTYAVGTNQLEVSYNGVLLYNGYQYSETSSSTITLLFTSEENSFFRFKVTSLQANR